MIVGQTEGKSWEVIGTSIPIEAPNKLMVMPSNNSGLRIGRLCGMFPGRIGWLIGPGGWRKPPPWMNVALDNGAYGAWDKNRPWDEAAWWSLLEQACSEAKPLWAVIPDVVTNKDATIAMWNHWHPIVRRKFPNLPHAFAVQDGMVPADVPVGANTVFIGGSKEWKWATLKMWTESFPRVHVAKVNTEKQLWDADASGAISCDGTGWFRGGDERLQGLENYLRASAAGKGPNRPPSPSGRPRHPIEILLNLNA